MVSVKILFLAHRIPFPPDKGEKIRAYQELRFLSSRHTVDLFAFADQAEQSAGRAALSAICNEVHLLALSRNASRARASLSLLSGRPFTTAYFYSARMAKLVREATARNNYDVIFVYCSAMAPYVAHCPPAMLCIDFVDSDASKWEQYARYAAFPMSTIYKREARKLGEYEKELAQRARLSLVSTPLEIEAIDPDGKFGVRALQNGVAKPAPPSAVPPPQIASLGKYVVFVGQMDYLPNVDAASFFAKDILPKIRKSHAALQFAIVGRNPSPRVLELAKLSGVSVIGAVPEVQPYLENAVAAVAPFRICQGVQNKILEALAIGLPVVATPRPARAVGATSSELLFVAHTPEEFARVVIQVLETQPLRGRGKEFIQEHFDWERNLEPLDRWLLEVPVASQPTREETRNYVTAV
jgi:sugar transferase (PEP-CTERM/EpsH1 system associated)